MLFASIDCQRCGESMDVEKAEYFDKRLLCPTCRSLGSGYDICKNCIRYSQIEHKCTFNGAPKEGEDECDTIVKFMHY